jgi:hypothetical protein
MTHKIILIYHLTYIDQNISTIGHLKTTKIPQHGLLEDFMGGLSNKKNLDIQGYARNENQE